MAHRGGQFVSRGGEKLHAALEAFSLDLRGFVCADFGASTGGFTDCMLQHGARRVYAVDTGYGQLAWKLRTDPRVVVMERTNALYCPPPQRVDLAAIDLGWTPQSLSIPAARRWLRDDGQILSLLKPHYEWQKHHGQRPAGPLRDDQCTEICRLVCARLHEQGHLIRAILRSALRGKGGNAEFFLLLGARPPQTPAKPPPK